MGRLLLHPGWAAFLCLAPIQAFAQVAPQPGQPSPAHPANPGANVGPGRGAVEQIVVTANKRRELQRTVANSVTAISGRQLERKQQVRIQDLVADVPGLSLEADDKTAVRIVLRGLNTGSAGATVASVLDDVPTNATAAQTNASTNTPNFDTYDLQRIEVLRGPQGTLYGATAEGGLIKYVTNPPDPTRYAGGLESGIDGTPDGGIGGTLKGFANVPFADGHAALRLTGWNEWFPGYIDNPTSGKTESNSAQQYGYRASVLLNPTDELSIRVTAQRESLFSNNADSLQVRGNALNLSPAPANQFGLLPGLVNNTLLPQPSQNETAVYYADVNYDFGFASLTSITAFDFAKFKSLLDVTNTNVAPGVPISEVLAPAYGLASVPVDERQNSNTDKFSQEVRLTSDPGFQLFDHRVDWLAGGYFTRETSAFLQYLDALDPANFGRALSPAAGGTVLYGALSEWATFGNVDVFLLPNVDVALGGRWSGTAQHSSATDICCLTAGPTNALPQNTSNAHDALYSVAPRWRPTDDLMIYGRIASGYRPGGPNIPVPGFPQAPTYYQPDRTVNYEIGARQDLFQKTVSVDVTGYYINWHNVQVLSVYNTPTGAYSVDGNAGTAVSRGVEWSLSWSPLRGLTLSAVGDYTDSQLTSNSPGLGGFKGDALPYVPNITNSINAEYDWTPIDGYKAYVSGTWSHIGARYTGFAPAGLATLSHIRLPQYDTGSLRLGVSRGEYSAELYANNVGDARGITFYSNQGGASETGQATIITPTIVGMVLRAAF